MMVWLVIALVFGLALILSGRRTRRSHGLGQGRTLDLDTRNMYSAKFGLSGRPDRIFQDGDFVIPEEWKSSPRVYDSHIAQLAVYFLLVEEEYGVRPPYSFIVLGDNPPVKVENTDQLRAWVLRIADQIRAAQRQLDVPIQVRQPAAKCRACGMRDRCGQRSG
jgi:CRISPR-associated exonuclease Cas4